MSDKQALIEFVQEIVEAFEEHGDSDLNEIPVSTVIDRGKAVLGEGTLKDESMPTPASRADKIAAALDDHGYSVTDDHGMALRDMLTDARHFADAHNINYSQQDSVAYRHYCDEKINAQKGGAA